MFILPCRTSLHYQPNCIVIREEIAYCYLENLVALLNDFTLNNITLCGFLFFFPPVRVDQLP